VGETVGSGGNSVVVKSLDVGLGDVGVVLHDDVGSLYIKQILPNAQKQAGNTLYNANFGCRDDGWRIDNIKFNRAHVVCINIHVVACFVVCESWDTRQVGQTYKHHCQNI